MSEPMADRGVAPQAHPPAEEVFAERVAPLVELVERWQARIATETEAGGWPVVPLAELGRDDPRRLPLEVAEELLRARGHLLAAVERVRTAAELRRRMREGPDGGPDGEPAP